MGKKIDVAIPVEEFTLDNVYRKLGVTKLRLSAFFKSTHPELGKLSVSDSFDDVDWDKRKRLNYIIRISQVKYLFFKDEILSLTMQLDFFADGNLRYVTTNYFGNDKIFNRTLLDEILAFVDRLMEEIFNLNRDSES